jgi:Cys-tRNA(Pro) deacylase
VLGTWLDPPFATATYTPDVCRQEPCSRPPETTDLVRRSPVTPAVRILRGAGIDYEEHLFNYQPGGAVKAAEETGLDPHATIKTLVLETSERQPFIVLMHGDREVSTKKLARNLGVKSVDMMDPAGAQRLTGYRVGGTSPFGCRADLPVYIERSILDLERLTINGGKRGFLVTLATTDLAAILEPVPVDVAI